MGVFENKNYNYSLMEIKDENERKAVRKAKMEAVKEFFKVDTITELGTGSGGRTIVYQVNHYAVKVICGVTQKCNGENLNSKIIELDSLIAENLNINKNFCREMINMTILSSITDNTAGKLNIIPFTGTATRLSWKCDSFNRIGVDYAIQMPLAKCLTDEMDTYKFQKQDIPKEHPEDFTKILTVGIDLCDALIVMQMHQNKLIHQDIKPQNIFLYHDNYCLGDFGIAREEDSPQFFQEGTRNYWAPEQANGSSVDHRCDIYSLGLVLYELADTVPVHNHYEQRIDDKKLPELESDIPEGLKKVLSNACEYEPDFRYQTAEAMKKDLCRLMEDPDYVPSSTRDNYYSSRKATSQPGRSQMSSGISLPSRNIMRSGPANFQRQRQANRFLQPETAWKAGKLWYEESRRTGCRFAGLNIDKTIMPLSAVSSNAVNFPINVSTNPEETVGLKPLSGVLKYPETLHNMYLIGEGGIGKTTALNSIMEDTYRDKAYHPAENGKNIIPLFVELSKALADYCSAYHASHSTFIQRYLYMLLGSVDKQYLLSENTEEMSRIMDRDDTSIMENIDQLLRADEEHTQYLLLLDGLNEVSKKQLSTKEKDFLGAPSELIVEEIKELLEKHKNITVIITSRADETLSDLDASFERLFLTGVNEDIIKEYLDGCKISSEQVSKNSRLMETLKIPLFLKLYGELYNTADISTPGEILYSFFSERSTKYTARNRIAEIKMDRQKAGDGYETNSLDEKMQGFILDFLLPELGWYMEKNDLYAVDLPTFKQIIDTVLKEETDTDICGIYGRKYFKEYLKGEDPVPNTQTYAKQLLVLEGPLGEDYVSVIAKYCVYSLGILYANNQNYSFIHQHIRDFFAAMKIITDMKMALYVAEKEKLEETGSNDDNKQTALLCLSSISTEYISETVSLFIGEILKEYKNEFQSVNGESKICIPEGKRSLLTKILALYKKNFSGEASIGIAIHNLLDIFEKARGNLNGMNLSELDLSKCSFNGIPLKEALLNGALVTKHTFFPNGHDSSITCIRISPDGEFFLTGDSCGTVKQWHLKTRKYIQTIIDSEYSINNIQYVHDGAELLVSTIKGACIYDVCCYEIKKNYPKTKFALSDKNAEKLILANNSVLKKAEMLITGYNTIFNNKVEVQILDRVSNTKTKLDIVREDFCANLISFSPDEKYIVLINTHNQLAVFENDSTKKNIAKIPLDAVDNYGTDCEKKVCFATTKNLTVIKEKVYISLCFDSTGRYLAIANDHEIKIIQFQKLLMEYASLGSQTDVMHIGNIVRECLIWQTSVFYFDSESVSSIKFVNKDSFLAVAFSSRTICLYDFSKYPHGNDQKIGSLLSEITCIDETYAKGSNLMITCDIESNILIWYFKNAGSQVSMSNIVPIYDSSLKTIDNITGTANLLYISSKQEGSLRYDAELNKVRIYPQKNKELYNYSVFSHSKKICVTGRENGNICIGSPFTHLNGFVKVSDKRILYMEFSPNDKLLLITLHDAAPQVVDMSTYSVSTLTTFRNKSDKAVFSKDGEFIFCCNGNFIEKFSAETFERINYVKEYCEPYLENLTNHTLNLFKKDMVQYNSSTSIIASPEFTYHQYNSKVTAISCSPDGLYLAVAWSSGKIEIREMETLSCIAILEANNGNVKTISFNANGHYMAIPFGKSSVKIYDTETWHCISILHGISTLDEENPEKKGHSDLVTSIFFDKNIGRITELEKIITASNDGTIKYWNPFSPKITASLSYGDSYKGKLKKFIYIFWKKFDLVAGVITGDDGTTLRCNDICECEKTIYFVPGLDVNGAILHNLNPASDLTKKDLDILKLYGAEID